MQINPEKKAENTDQRRGEPRVRLGRRLGLRRRTSHVGLKSSRWGLRGRQPSTVAARWSGTPYRLTPLTAGTHARCGKARLLSRPLRAGSRGGACVWNTADEHCCQIGCRLQLRAAARVARLDWEIWPYLATLLDELRLYRPLIGQSVKVTADMGCEKTMLNHSSPKSFVQLHLPGAQPNRTALPPSLTNGALWMCVNQAADPEPPLLLCD